MNWSQILLPISIFVSVLLVGIILRFSIIRYLHKLTMRTRIPWDEVIVSTFKNFILLWAFLLALHISLSFTKIPSHIFSLVNKTLLILFLFSLAISGTRLLIKLVDLYLAHKTGISARITLIEIFIKITVYSIAFITILHILDINIAPFITTLGIAGLAVGLALKDTLENFFSGIHILMARQIKPGDFIRLESGEEGFVEDINWRTTTIKTQQNNLVIIPNAKLAQSRILNYHLPIEELSVLVNVGVSYNSDLEKVEKVTLEVAQDLMKTHPLGVPEFEPMLRYHTFGDFSINFNVILRCKEAGSRFQLIHDFIKALHSRYKQEGIEIPYPIRTVYLHSVDSKSNLNENN